MDIVERQIELIEASLGRLGARLPDLPINEVVALRLIFLLAHEFSAMLEHHIRPYGLGEGEFRVLSALFSQPGGTAHPGDLCARASQSPANMSRISDALVRLDLITRDASAEDRRRMVLRITANGEALVRRLLPQIFAPLRELYRNHSEGEQRQLIDLLKRLAGRFGQVTASADADSAVDAGTAI
ncbi:MAG TPA: MarR family transcriptional regulator [Steroidobacteraceae bacterium]|nr:MarR family transcriptional regulator [Steroidobacteraceae bacterium]